MDWGMKRVGSGGREGGREEGREARVLGWRSLSPSNYSL